MLHRIFVFGLVLFISGCGGSNFFQSTDPYTGERKLSQTTKGAGIGAGLGALGGLIYGEVADTDRRKAALIGAGLGAATGGAIGQYQDRQEAVLRERLQNTGVSVTRRGATIVLNMPGNVTFNSAQDTIRSEFYPVLNSVALVLAEFDQTRVNVFGHTDSDGSDSYNEALSRRRATNVAQYLIYQGTHNSRFHVAGYGESRPIAPNTDDYNKSLNRRVEIEIDPLSSG